jgi:integrase
VPKQKWRHRLLERGVVIDKRGYVYVRYRVAGGRPKELIGKTTDPEVIDRANFRAIAIRHGRRRQGSDFEPRKARLLVQDAADLFLRLHGEKRQSIKGAKQFSRYVRFIKEAWSDRYVDTITRDDVHDYREKRRKQGVVESTINREHTAITTLFNRLTEWRRSGQIPRNCALPEENPGRGVRKVNEDRFIRQRLLTDTEYENLFACADQRLRRILVAVLNLPLRLEDLRRLSLANVDRRRSQFTGIQAKTGREYYLPINEPLWDLIRTTSGDRLLDFTGFRRSWDRALRQAGLEGLQFRDLRRTAATALHESGRVSLRTISAMLGHASVTTTIRYLGLKNENLAEAGNVLAAKYGCTAENGLMPVQRVPKRVPNVPQNDRNELSKTDHKVEDFGGVAQLVRAAAS